MFKVSVVDEVREQVMSMLVGHTEASVAAFYGVTEWGSKFELIEKATTCELERIFSIEDSF